MGQQQLLLLVLGIVIVGLAVVAGINAFEENSEKSQKDAIVNEGMRIATDIQAYALKPDQLGGGGGSLPSTLSGAGIDTGINDGGTPDDDTDDSNFYQTPWGKITYTESSGTGTLTLSPSDSGETADITFTKNGSPQMGSWSS